MTALAKFLGILALVGAGIDFDDGRPPIERTYGRTCLALVGFSEARDQDDIGLAMVMQVVINRATDRAGRWPRTLCEVALQSGQFVGVDHWPTPRHPERIDAGAWRRALEMADRVIAGNAPLQLDCAGATGFDQSAPSNHTGIVCRIGAHSFYTEAAAAIAEK